MLDVCARRGDILRLLSQEVYGAAPVEKPAGMRVEERDEGAALGGQARRYTLGVSYEGLPGRGCGGFQVRVFLPAARELCPVFLLLCNRDLSIIDAPGDAFSPFWPAEQIVARGYGAAALHLAQLDPDEHDGFANGVHGLFDQQRTPSSWGTIAAWAWGARRALDALLTLPRVDAGRVAVVGHSRGGKAALWAGACDERFALTVSNESGCTGAAYTRGKQGESVQRINQRFPHWFCENYHAYGGREEDMPFDQHLLLASVAPRLLYVASAQEDTWSDPVAEFRACKLATPAWEAHGRKGLAATSLPPAGEASVNGCIGYHMRAGGHDLLAEDWHRFMDAADRHGWGRKP